MDAESVTTTSFGKFDSFTTNEEVYTGIRINVLIPTMYTTSFCSDFLSFEESLSPVNFFLEDDNSG